MFDYFQLINRNCAAKLAENAIFWFASLEDAYLSLLKKNNKHNLAKHFKILSSEVIWTIYLGPLIITFSHSVNSSCSNYVKRETTKIEKTWFCFNSDDILSSA